MGAIVGQPSNTCLAPAGSPAGALFYGVVTDPNITWSNCALARTLAARSRLAAAATAGA